MDDAARQADATVADATVLASLADTQPIPIVVDTEPPQPPQVAIEPTPPAQTQTQPAGSAQTDTELPGLAQAGTPTPVFRVGAAPQEREAQEPDAQEPDAQEPEAQEREADGRRPISRRALIQAGMIGGAGVAALPLLALVGSMAPTSEPQPTNLTFPLNTNWLFGGQYTAGSESTFYDDSGFAPVVLPHTVTTLSWQDWDLGTWQQVWIYRRHFDGEELLSSRPPGNRILVRFDGVMVNASVVINDQAVGTHRGGYLPFSAELTGYVTSGDNLLAVVVDSRSLPVPPISFGHGPHSIDFFQPGGIYRDVSLQVLPRAFLSDMFALPVDVLSSQPQVDVECTIDSAVTGHAVGTLLVELLDGSRPIGAQVATVSLTSPGISTTKLSLTGFGPISLWSTESPKLYTVQATLALPGVGSHVLSRRIGFREASFQPDGFYLNGERMQLFGLNRHQLFPYAGMAMPARVQRKDVEILKNQFNCNMVRCSHYPQSPHFLDACDELGLLVWEEAPGWHDVSTNPVWQDLVVQNVRDMVIRDRSRPSVVIWGTRLNETPDLPGLWAATRQAAAELDGSRPSSGAMAYHDEAEWNEDVFAYNDYDYDPDTGDATLQSPMDGLPYLVTEAVGVDEMKPRHFAWTDPPAMLAKQAALHAEVQSLARSSPGYSGLLAWAAFDYASPVGLDPDSDSVKWAGVADGFRIPKPGAAIYLSQVNPGIRPVIVPVFFWEIGQPQAEPTAPPAQQRVRNRHGRVSPPPPAGPAPAPSTTVMIASNCQQLRVFIDGMHLTTALPAADSPLYGHLAYPPFLVALPTPARGDTPELLVEGYVHGQQVTEIRMSSDPTGDVFAMAADDAAIYADGSDATRVVFRAVDAYGNQRRHLTGQVALTLTGPAMLVGDNPFAFGEYGGLGAVWIRSLAGQPGTITLGATLPELGHAEIQVRSIATKHADQVV
jgi:beta-galactosidase